MASVCKICAGPIEPLDQHLHCVACLGLAHAEAALDESDCGLCADLPVRVLRARRDVVRGLFGVGLTAASVPLVSPPSPGGGSAVLPCRRTQRSPHSPISFPEDCFRPPSNIEGFVAFGHEEGDEAMSISASEKDGWAGSEPEQLGSSEPSGLQEELMRVLSKAVQELELTWNPPEEPVRSKLDSWYFRSTRKADARTSVPFFPDVHEQLVKTWSAPQSARVPLEHAGHVLPRGWSGGPRLRALSPRRGDRCCTPVPCSSEVPRPGHQPAVEAVQNHRPSR